jgi:hypothetical protein
MTRDTWHSLFGIMLALYVMIAGALVFVMFAH